VFTGAERSDRSRRTASEDDVTDIGGGVGGRSLNGGANDKIPGTDKSFASHQGGSSWNGSGAGRDSRRDNSSALSSSRWQHDRFSSNDNASRPRNRNRQRPGRYARSRSRERTDSFSHRPRQENMRTQQNSNSRGQHDAADFGSRHRRGRNFDYDRSRSRRDRALDESCGSGSATRPSRNAWERPLPRMARQDGESPDRWNHDMWNPKERSPSPPQGVLSLRALRKLQMQNGESDGGHMSDAKSHMSDALTENTERASTIASLEVHPPTSVALSPESRRSQLSPPPSPPPSPPASPTNSL